MKIDQFIQVAPGLEEALVAELQDLDISGRAEPGGVAIRSDFGALARIHVWSRCASRVIVRVGTFEARNAQSIAAGVRKLRWGDWLHPSQPLQVKATLHGGAFRRRDVVEKKISLAIGDALRSTRRAGKPVRYPATVLARVEGMRFTLSVDASGDLLHRRGWRTESVAAPLRENLAAGLLRAAGWEPGMTLVDPMCGSGTFGIEAAQWAMGLAPGGKRRFAFESFPSLPQGVLDKARKRRPRRADTLVISADRDDGAVQATRRNAKRAGVQQGVEVLQRDFADLEPPQGRPGLVVLNPPYGQRLQRGRGEGAYRFVGQVLRERWTDWRYLVLAPAGPHGARLGLKPEKSLRIRNGGLEVNAMIGRI